jgi:hypothetical protein
MRVHSMEQIPARNTHIKYVMKFPAVYKTLRFIAVFTKDIMQIYSRNTCTELATANYVIFLCTRWVRSHHALYKITQK